MCTASILHLVVISLDRYIAVTHPITYPNLMTSKKAKLLITGAWILSFVICFPPLVGWNDKDEEEGAESDLNSTSSKNLLLKTLFLSYRVLHVFLPVHTGIMHIWCHFFRGREECEIVTHYYRVFSIICNIDFRVGGAKNL